MADHVRLTPMQRVRVRFAGQLIVDTTRGYKVEEGMLPPRFYVPREDVRASLGVPGQGGRCPWKGAWHHLDVTSGDTTVRDAAWTYPETTPTCDPIRGFVAFYAQKVDAIEAE